MIIAKNIKAHPDAVGQYIVHDKDGNPMVATFYNSMWNVNYDGRVRSQPKLDDLAKDIGNATRDNPYG